MFIELTPHPPEADKKLLVNLANVAYFKTSHDLATWVVFTGLEGYDIKVKESTHRIQDLLTAKGYNR